MSNRYKEFFAIIAVLLFALLISILVSHFNTNGEINSVDFAQILAELLAVIFVLPQVIIQLTLRPQRGDIKSIFSGFIRFYLFYYIIAIIFLACNIAGLSDIKYITFFMFLSALLLIFPYFYFLIQEYSTSANFFNENKNKMLKQIKALEKGENTNGSENNNELRFSIAEQKILHLIEECKEYVLTYGKEGNNIFSIGVDTLTELVETSYHYNKTTIDNLLIEILEIITDLGIKAESDNFKSYLNKKLFQIADSILESSGSDDRINLFVTKIVMIIEKISTHETSVISQELLKESIVLVQKTSRTSLRQATPKLIEYHLLAEAFKRMGVYSINKSFENTTRDALQNLGNLVEMSMRKLPIEDVPIYKICDVLTEIGVIASKKKQEVFVIQCINRIILIIADIKTQNLKVDINLCMASLLELIANVWVFFDVMADWMSLRLYKMSVENSIDYKEYIDSTKEILEAKSVISTTIFNDFVDGIDGHSAEENNH